VDAAVTVEGLTKRFGAPQALDGVDLAVAEGTVLSTRAYAWSTLERTRLRSGRTQDRVADPHLLAPKPVNSRLRIAATVLMKVCRCAV